MKKILTPGAFNIHTHNDIISQAWKEHFNQKGAAIFMTFATTETNRIELLAAPGVPVPELIHRLKEAIANLERQERMHIVLPS